MLESEEDSDKGLDIESCLWLADIRSDVTTGVYLCVQGLYWAQNWVEVEKGSARRDSKLSEACVPAYTCTPLVGKAGEAANFYLLLNLTLTQKEIQVHLRRRHKQSKSRGSDIAVYHIIPCSRSDGRSYSILPHT